MLACLGLVRMEDGRVQEAPLTQVRPAWMRRPDHTEFRITRILLCLRATDLVAESQALLDFLKTQFATDPSKEESLSYWRNTAPASRSGALRSNKNPSLP
jgi:hypothetical protein